ncbi:hypothetical protein DJ568_09435 [Mucilaginibacter hurinus]|uniref:Capsule polysaccharide biosynthesis protein n=1 Tax=Mucilaginibacter hurinus TaxID=2201324 RepID=A0A367GNU2_9SPHI|nr:hypothetical protein [Mucilaginibacter hurinus]RCH54705.1 hypothetical protein DJ568_09435 [Mucilaginibacter hurinus]
MRPVLISCIPRLNDIQQKGLLRLIKDLEGSGLQVKLWSDHKYERFSKYDIEKIIFPVQEKNQYRRYWNIIKTRFLLDGNKWLQRIKQWNGNGDSNFARAELKKYVNESARVFTIINPLCFICWNPYCCRFGVAYDAAKILGIKTAGIDWGFLPDTFILDSKGVLATSAIFNTDPLADYNAGSRDVFTKKGTGIYQQLKATSLSIYQQAEVKIPADFKLKDKEMVKVLVLGIGEIDAGAYPADHPERKGLLPFHESAYEQAVDIARMNTNYRVIFKPHPSHNQFKQDKRVNSNLAIVNGNPDELIDWADVVFCSGSKMEFSVILKGKPLLTYGAGLLYGKQCSYEIKSPASVQTQITKAMHGLYDDRNQKNFVTFLGYLDCEYLYNFTGNKNHVIDSLLHNNT